MYFSKKYNDTSWKYSQDDLSPVTGYWGLVKAFIKSTDTWGSKSWEVWQGHRVWSCRLIHSVNPFQACSLNYLFHLLSSSFPKWIQLFFFLFFHLSLHLIILGFELCVMCLAVMRQLWHCLGTNFRCVWVPWIHKHLLIASDLFFLTSTT